MRAFLLLAALLLPCAAAAQTMFKCRNADGTSAYQQHPCADAKASAGEAYIAPEQDSGATWQNQYGERLRQVQAAERRAAREAARIAAIEQTIAAEMAALPATPPAHQAPASVAPAPIIQARNTGYGTKFTDQSGTRYKATAIPGTSQVRLRDTTGQQVARCVDDGFGNMRCR